MIRHLLASPRSFRAHVDRIRRSGFLNRTLAFLLMLCASGQRAHNQQAQHSSTSALESPVSTTQILSAYEGQKVTAIEIAGRPQSTTSDYESFIQQHAGQPFSKEKIEKTVAAFNASGKFQSVRVQVEAEADGVRVLLILEPAVYFGIFQFPGAERFSYSRLVQVANFITETPFNAADVEHDRKDLLKFFQQEGYFKAEVRPEVKVDSGEGIANIVFHVSLARHANFGDIVISGAPPEQAATLKHSLRTAIARAKGAAIRPGHSYHYSTLTKATQYLQARLEKQGRLDAQVKLEGAEYHAGTNRADIHFTVNTGPVTHVAIEGAHIWSWTRKALLPVYQGIPVDDESVQEGRRALASYFQAKGFFDVKVDAQLKSDSKGNTIVYKVTKEKKRKVASVELSGNTHIPSSDLDPHLTVKKKHLFSPGKFSDQLVRSSVDNLKAVYKSEGFSSVQVAPSVANRGKEIAVIFMVTEGPRDIVNSLTIAGADTFPQSKFAPDGLKLAAGHPYSQAHVEADRASIIAHYLQAGYLNASFRETAASVSKTDNHSINVVYRIFEGPRVDTGSVITLGRLQTHQRLIDKDVASIRPGKPLTESHLLTAGTKLYNHTGVFDWAEVDPKRQITTQTSEDVLVKVHEAKRNEFTYGFGFEVINRGGSIPSGTVALPGLPPVGLPANFTASQVTFYGPRGTAQYTRNNIRGKGESFSLTGFAGRLDQRLAAYYIDPTLRWSHWKATTSISGERNEENPVFSSQQELGSFQVQRSLDKANKDTLFLRYSFTQTDLTRIAIPGLVPSQDQHVRLSGLAANFTRDTRDNAMDEHKGLLESIELDLNTTKLGSSVDFAKLTGQAAYYKQIIHNTVWANSLRIGLAQPFAGSRVPLSEEFFTGGGNSLRGFPLDSAGPQRQVFVCSGGATTGCPQIEVPSGGNELLLINSEARVPLPFKKNLGIVAFYDGGNVFSLVGFHNFVSLYSNNAGLGLRYSTPVGPIRFDLGRNLNPIPGIQATQYFISIGQAF